METSLNVFTLLMIAITYTLCQKQLKKFDLELLKLTKYFFHEYALQWIRHMCHEFDCYL